ncbi:MAG: phosphotransferase [Bacilli bacterium]|nr:phosphotransferase [Bacilli bacterium]MBR1581989.1 phosphotransferase [Bacilli bacterium]
MEFKLDGNELRLIFVGEINSATAASVEEDVNKTLEGKQFEKLILDFEKVVYVSSAGLRIILKLKQKYKDVSIINASLEVYDVLQMTGFTNLMEIKKALAVVDVTGCEIIGTGYYSKVYRINKDTIIKVYERQNDIKEIERELNLCKQAFILGIPTAISFDIVKVNDKLGVRFEMLDSHSLRDLFVNYPERFDELCAKYANLLKKINTTESTDETLPDAKKEWFKKLEAIQPYLDVEDFFKCRELLKGIPYRKTFIHGDCHVKNIMVQGDELFLIDMDTLSIGHPIFELAAIYATYCAFEEDIPGNNEVFLKMNGELTRKMYIQILKDYFDNYNEDILNKIRIVSYIHMMWWDLTFEPESLKHLDKSNKKLAELLKQYNDLDIGA